MKRTPAHEAQRVAALLVLTGLNLWPGPTLAQEPTMLRVQFPEGPRVGTLQTWSLEPQNVPFMDWRLWQRSGDTLTEARGVVQVPQDQWVCLFVPVSTATVPNEPIDVERGAIDSVHLKAPLDVALPLLRQLEGVQALTVQGGCTRDGVEAIAALSSVHTLLISGEDEELLPLEDATQLEQLTVSCTTFSAALGSIVATLPKLEVLEIHTHDFAPGSIEALQFAPALHSISFHGFGTRPTAEAMAAIAKNPSLRAMHMGREDLTPEHFAALADNGHLEWLGVGFGIHDNQAKEIGRIKTLKHAHFGTNFFQGDAQHVSINGFKSLCDLENLESLRFDYDNSDASEAVSYLRNLQKLQELSLVNWFHLKDEHLQDIATLKSLRILELRGENLTSAGVAYLRELPALESLRFFIKPAITENDIAALKEHIPTLKSVVFDP